MTLSLEKKFMQCPYCSAIDICVLESRVAEDGTSIRRRRKCNECEKRFTTYERVEGLDLKVIKKNGMVETFDKEKIKKGLIKATWKRPVKMGDLDNLVEEVERELRRQETTTIRSWEIGEMVIARLKVLDPLGYLLFASVYRDFNDLTDFRLEIDKLLTHIKLPQGDISEKPAQ